MRWPTGLSGFERQEMGSIPSPLHIHFCACPKSYANAENNDPDAAAILPAVRSDHASAATLRGEAVGEEAVVRSGMHGCGSQVEADSVPQLPRPIYPGQQPNDLLLSQMREHVQADQGTVSEGEGERALAFTASGGEGAGIGPTIAVGRDCSPPRRDQVEQRSEQSRHHDDACPLAAAHAGQPARSAFDQWRIVQSTFLSALCSTPEAPAQASLFGD